MLTLILGLAALCLVVSLRVVLNIARRLSEQNDRLRRRLQYRDDLSVPSWVRRSNPRPNGRRGYLYPLTTPQSREES